MLQPSPGIEPPTLASHLAKDSLARVVITPVRHTHTRLHTPLSNTCSSPSSLQHTRGLTSPACLFTATLSAVFCTEVRSICTALPARRTVIRRQCNSVETAQPGNRTTAELERYASSQRVDSLARVVITPVCHTHTRLHL